jgi:hypothetical protein
MHSRIPSCQARHVGRVNLACCAALRMAALTLVSWPVEIQSIARPPAKHNGFKGISAAYAFVLVAYVTLAASAYWVGAAAWDHSCSA